MASIEWSPIAEVDLHLRIKQGMLRMNLPEARLWEAVRIPPEKWLQTPYGEQGGGFWVVAITGTTVIWYNDIEEGFNRSQYSMIGRIDDYWCNQDELEITLSYLLNAITKGEDIVRLAPPSKLSQP